MLTFEELYRKAVSAAAQGIPAHAMEKSMGPDCDGDQLDCLLHPKKHPPVWRIGACACTETEKSACAADCAFDALHIGKDGVEVDPDQCIGCGECIRRCAEEKMIASKDIIPVLETVRSAKGLSYALIAPAFLGQFSGGVTPGKLRAALKKVGFDGMLEVALFADILTLKEALEFDRHIRTERDYQLTSCCCPMWIAMIRKVYRELLPHVPGSVSPMIACGRAVKLLHPDAVTVFIGPCIAKKAEAREKDIAGAVDYVLTFQEMQEIFNLMEIDPAAMEEHERDHSSRAGRIYARAGGVSEAVERTLHRITPHRAIDISTRQADGVPACRAMLSELQAGQSNANFFEGMGCVGGCVGGPKAILNRDLGRVHVEEYGDAATYPTPIDNPYVIEMLRRLGFDTVEQLLEEDNIFTREL